MSVFSGDPNPYSRGTKKRIRSRERQGASPAPDIGVCDECLTAFDRKRLIKGICRRCLKERDE